MEHINAVGRRKTSIARVYLSAKGTGKITVNQKELKNYFTQLLLDRAIEPLTALQLEKKHDVSINVQGGGTTGQADAIRLGIARALCKLNPDYRLLLKPKGFLTRDARSVERKKYGLLKARKKTQYRKR